MSFPPLNCTAVFAGLLLSLMLFPSCAMAQKLTNTSDGTLTATIPLQSLGMPGTSKNPATTQIQFRLRSNDAKGYHIEASANFTATPATVTAGGSTISASDIGVAITSIVYGNDVIKNGRIDTINSGFNYNPGAVTATNGLTPFTGISTGRGTLADIIANPGIKLLDGPKIGSDERIDTSTNYMTVTITFGLLGQFFTPATLSGTITLTMKSGQ